jgi:hypothetical protein
MSFSFLDEAKKDHLYTISMINMIGDFLPQKTDLHCFWCRHLFTNSPIGCPIEYISHRIIKKCVSESTKDTFFIRENISKTVYDKIQSSLHHVSIHDKDFYIVDGIFCSFPCVMAFIKDNKYKNPLYSNSETLLHSMYRQTFNINQLSSILCAPSWRLLEEYGGNMNIQEFRKNFQNTDYISMNQIIKNIPCQKVIGFLYEKQIKL